MLHLHYSSVPSFIHSFIHPFIHRSIHPFIQQSSILCTCTHSFNHSALMCAPSRAFQAVYVCVCGQASPGFRLYNQWSIRLELAHQAAAAVEFMHSHNVVHRDLTSNNLLVTGSQGTCSTKSSSESALCIVKCLLLCDDASLHT